MSRIAFTLALGLAMATPAFAQPTPAVQSRESPTISSAIGADVLRDLPNSENFFSILESTQPSLTSDRISGGDLYTGQASRIGGFLSSPSQTLFMLGDADISDPAGSGTPLMIPDVESWQQIQITTGLMPVRMNAPGVVVTLRPLDPTTSWRSTISGTGGLGTPSPGAGAFPIARQHGWDRASATATGPLLTDARGISRLGAALGASWTKESRFDRQATAAADATLASAFANLVFAPGERHRIQTIGWIQSAMYPSDLRAPFARPTSTTDDSAAHVQASWEQLGGDSARLRAYASYTQRSRTPDLVSTPTAIFDRFTDGPLSVLGSLSTNTGRRWSIGARLPSHARGMHTVEWGIEVGGARQTSTGFFSGAAGELINAIPARVWQFSAPASSSIRHETTVAADATDAIQLTPVLALDVGLRFDAVSGRADGAANGVSWRSWLPRATLSWTIADWWQLRAFSGYRRTADRLPLDLLAVGDPNAPTARIFQWLNSGTVPSLKDTGALIANAGPGTGGNAAFARIDTALKRPQTDELIIGIDAYPNSSLHLRFAGFLRREANLIGLVDTGAPVSAYTLTGLPDPGLQLLNPIDDQLLPVYNRLPATFGQDAYLLTNPIEDAATSKSIEISAALNMDRLVIVGGATANQSEAPAANVGYGPLENDQDLIGDLFVNPNAGTWAPHGRPFVDRAYTVKLSGVYRVTSNIHAGVIARYQDGQPFSRLVSVAGLNQGAEAIRAFPDGQSRFTFTGTLDARLEVGMPLGRSRVDVVGDAFNLLNMSNEVEEQTASGASFRTVTAIQPPRTFHVGVRVTF